MATTSSPTNPNWEKVKHACLDQKNLTKSPLPAEIMYDLQHWSEDEVSIKQRQQLHPQSIGAEETSKQTLATKRKRNIAIKIDKINNRYKGIQTFTDKNISKRLDQVARKKIRMATKVKDPKIFQQNMNNRRENFNIHTTYSMSTGIRETTYTSKEQWGCFCT